MLSSEIMLEKKSLKTSSVIQKWRHYVRGEGVPKISDKKWHRGRGYMQIKNANKNQFILVVMTLTTKIIFLFFLFFCLFLVSMVAAGRWLAFRC